MGHLAGFLPPSEEDQAWIPTPGSVVQVGQRLILVAGRQNTKTANLQDPQSGHVSLTAALATVLAVGHRKQEITKLAAAHDLACKNLIRCHALVTAMSGNTATVLLAVELPGSTWAKHSRWKASDKAAVLFAHLVPATLLPRWMEDAGGKASVASQQHQSPSYIQELRQDLEKEGMKLPGAPAGAFNLPECFRALPMKCCGSQATVLHTADDSRPCHLSQVSDDLLHAILARLDRISLTAAASTCRHLHRLTRDVAPGLMLDPFPHQREGAQWMQMRERATGPIPHPTVRVFHCLELGQDCDPFDAASEQLLDRALCGGAGSLAGGSNESKAPLMTSLPFWADTASGELFTESPPQLLDSPGGLYCDDPGLGKTITALMVILMTLRKLPPPPPAASITWVKPGVRAFYSLPPQEQGPASQPGRRRSRRGSVQLVLFDGVVVSDEEEVEALKQRYVEACETSLRKRCRLLSPRQQDEEQEQEQQISASSLNSAESSDAAAQDSHANEETWVQCDLCHKWRRLPLGHQAPSGDWACAMNPDPALQWQGCHAAQEGSGGTDTVRFCPGWVPADSLQGAERNITFYRRLLAQHPDQMDQHSPLTWLSRQPPRALMEAPFSVERERLKWHDSTGQLFQQMGLEVVLKQHSRGQQQQQLEQQVQGRSQNQSHSGSVGGSAWPRRRRRGLERSIASDSSEDEEEEWGDEGWSDAGLPSVGIDSEQEASDDAEQAGSAAGGGQEQRQRQRRRWNCTGRVTVLWQPPASHAALELDLEAVQAALCLGPLAEAPRILMSPATLVVVPEMEHIEHWRQQIRWHVRPEADLRVVVYTTSEGPKSKSRREQALTVQRLAWEADVIFTTFSTLTTEWSRHRSYQNMKKYNKHKRTGGEEAACPSLLLQIHFLRIILDEGHKVGKSDRTNMHIMATALRAERRWVMTGTPTPNTLESSIENLRPLLQFLHQQEYQDDKAWKKGLQEPFEARQEVGMLRLLVLLHRLLIRASKDELISLGIPPLKSKVSLLDFAPAHAQSYNGFVDIVRFNLLTADWFDADNKESLLNNDKRDRFRQTLENLRKSCNVAGNCQLQVLDSDVTETLQLLTHRHISCHAPSPSSAAAAAGSTAQELVHRFEQQEVLPPLGQLLADAGPEWGRRARHIRACLEEGGACDRCCAVVRVLCVAPCACLLCVECASLERTYCPQCSTPYVMQGVDDPARLRDNPNPKWDVPLELIEWQPAYAQRGAKGIEEGAWQVDWQHTQSTKCVHLLRRLLDVGAAVPRGSGRQPTSKAIVYTQFWEHMSVIERYLQEHGVALAMLKRTNTSSDKHLALSRFQHSPLVGVLLMDATGQVGLDLSFVSHVFLMEPIMDRSVEEQVVSRAHRMGAKQIVHVETLAMRGTVEEHIVKQLQQAQTQEQQQQQAQQEQGPATADTVDQGAVAGGAAAVAGTALEDGPSPAAPAAGTSRGAAGKNRGAAKAKVKVKGKILEKGKAKGKAEARKAELNALFLGLRPVPVRDLPEFEDLPGAGPVEDGRQQQPQQQDEIPPRRQQQQQQQQQQRQEAAPPLPPHQHQHQQQHHEQPLQPAHQPGRVLAEEPGGRRAGLQQGAGFPEQQCPYTDSSSSSDSEEADSGGEEEAEESKEQGQAQQVDKAHPATAGLVAAAADSMAAVAGQPGPHASTNSLAAEGSQTPPAAKHAVGAAATRPAAGKAARLEAGVSLPAAAAGQAAGTAAGGSCVATAAEAASFRPAKRQRSVRFAVDVKEEPNDKVEGGASSSAAEAAEAARAPAGVVPTSASTASAAAATAIISEPVDPRPSAAACHRCRGCVVEHLPQRLAASRDTLKGARHQC